MYLLHFHSHTEDETFSILNIIDDGKDSVIIILSLLLSTSGLSFSMCVCVTDLFSLFASDLGGYAAREDIEAVLKILDGETPASLHKCFIEVGQLDAPSSESFLLFKEMF